MDAKKQTAVEWLIGNLNQKIDFIPMDKWDMIRDIIQQAKAMEKEQIEQAFRDGFFDGCNPLIFKIDDEQYYKEKYESKTNI